jgi:hypothetical protein
VGEAFAQFGSGKTGRRVLARGDRVCVEARELRGTPARPGSIVAIDRGGWGFDMMVTSILDSTRGRFYRGQVMRTRGDVPWA